VFDLFDDPGPKRPLEQRLSRSARVIKIVVVGMGTVVGFVDLLWGLVRSLRRRPGSGS
jgi:hypothetical protein